MEGSVLSWSGAVASAAAGRAGLVIVGQSYGAFTATLAASLLPSRLLVLLADDPGPGRGDL